MKLTGTRAFSVVSLVLLLGCNKLPFGGQKAGPAGSVEGATADPAAAADEKLAEKLEEYLTGCLNSYARRDFRLSADSYLDNIDETKGPSEKQVPYLYKVDLKSITECEQAVAKAKAMQPALPELEGAVASYIAALKAGVPTVNEAQAYYSQKDYKDDKMTKGRAWHPQLVEIFKKVGGLSHALSDAFVKQKGPLDERDLERMKNKGPRVNYLTKRSIMDANNFAKLIDVKSVKEFYALPPTDLQPKIDVLIQDLSELQKVVEAKGKELEGTIGVDLYTHDLESFIKEAKEVTRRIRDKAKFTNTELERLGTSSGWMTEGSPDKLDREHESLINRYNGMRL